MAAGQPENQEHCRAAHDRIAAVIDQIVIRLMKIVWSG